MIQKISPPPSLAKRGREKAEINPFDYAKTLFYYTRLLSIIACNLLILFIARASIGVMWEASLKVSSVWTGDCLVHSFSV